MIKRNPYNYIKNKTRVEGWLHLIKGAKLNGSCLEPVVGEIDKNGYHRFKFNGKQYRANRFSWLVNFGEIPRGLFVCHKCDNPRCIQPRHLWIGTPLENMQDRDKKGRHRTADPSKTKHIGEDNHSSRLTEKDVFEIRRTYTPPTKSNGKGSNIKYLSEKFNVRKATIKLVIQRKTWTHI